ncbi:hypothetical protein HDU91_002708 [Kappamyces sp. JEL0680]|nr:hypothetical protein HDU91_002708 [Kappamyces sp. JEL0680]
MKFMKRADESAQIQAIRSQHDDQLRGAQWSLSRNRTPVGSTNKVIGSFMAVLGAGATGRHVVHKKNDHTSEQNVSVTVQDMARLQAKQSAGPSVAASTTSPKDDPERKRQSRAESFLEEMEARQSSKPGKRKSLNMPSSVKRRKALNSG